MNGSNGFAFNVKVYLVNKTGLIWDTFMLYLQALGLTKNKFVAGKHSKNKLDGDRIYLYFLLQIFYMKVCNFGLKSEQKSPLTQ